MELKTEQSKLLKIQYKRVLRAWSNVTKAQSSIFTIFSPLFKVPKEWITKVSAYCVNSLQFSTEQ